MRTIGIDPGLRITGYACVDAGPSLVEAGVFRLVSARERATGQARSIADRLVELERDVSDLISRLTPGVIAVEGLFAHYKHPATAIAMGHARGVILLAARRAGLDLVELKPAAVKKFMTGSGNARKPQMQAAVRDRLRLARAPEPHDVADAIALALCASSRAARP